MTRTMYSAAVFALTIVLTQANQCPGGGVCPGDDASPKVLLSLLQAQLQVNVLETGREAKNNAEDNSNDQIAELMAQKNEAIASEDFVVAQNLKTEINALQFKAATLGVSHAVQDVDGKKESLVGNMLMLNKPAAILTEFEQKVAAGEAPAFDVISQIKTLIQDDVMPYLKDSRDQAIQQATELRALVTACNDDFKSSDAYPGSTMEQVVNTARSNHITCRDVQEAAHDFNLTQLDSYCVKLGNLLHDTLPLSSPGASASPRATSVASVVSALNTIPSCNSDVLQLDANCTQQEAALANKRQECSVKQETFEFRYCEWKDGLESKCKTLDSCYSTTSGLYNAHVAQMKVSLEKWDIENNTLHTILCYCNVWLNGTDSADNRSQHNATHFDVCKGRTHRSEVVELKLTQKEDCLLDSVSNHPGTQGFTDQEYRSFTEFVEPVIPCVPECSANKKLVADVCVECPAGKASPGGKSTMCNATFCGTDEKVVGHVCFECAPGKTSTGNHDASGGDTQCQVTRCDANEKVVDHVCVQCPAGKTSTGNDDASGGNTHCEATTTTTTTTTIAACLPRSERRGDHQGDCNSHCSREAAWCTHSVYFPNVVPVRGSWELRPGSCKLFDCAPSCTNFDWKTCPSPSCAWTGTTCQDLSAPKAGGTCSNPDPHTGGGGDYVCPSGYTVKVPAVPTGACTDAATCNTNCCNEACLPREHGIVGDHQGDCNSVKGYLPTWVMHSVYFPRVVPIGSSWGLRPGSCKLFDCAAPSCTSFDWKTCPFPSCAWTGTTCQDLSAPKAGGTCSNPDPHTGGGGDYVCPSGYTVKVPAVPRGACTDAATCNTNCCNEACSPRAVIRGDHQGDCNSVKNYLPTWVMHSVWVQCFGPCCKVYDCDPA